MTKVSTMVRSSPVCLFLALTLLSGLADAKPAAESYPHSQPELQALADAPSQDQLRSTMTKLVGFGTRHTTSDTKSDTRGIGAARRWVKSRFEAISKDCGGCLEIVTPSQMVSGERVSAPTEIMDIVAIKRGSDDPAPNKIGRVIAMTGHLDSRVT
ncbi:MAG: hypothetical protein PF483_11770, partial [Halothiobacillus sp.]|nr:hypothetical protein [Halothiobacillus sp.]